MYRLGAQLYTVREFMTTEKDVFETLSKIKKMGYETVQTVTCPISYKKIGEFADEIGLKVVGHVENIDSMYNNFEQVLENCQFLNTNNMSVGFKKFTCLDDVKLFIEQANIVAEKASKNGMKFNYHNHHFEFVKFENGKIVMDMLYEGLDPNNSTFVLDTYWVQYGGGDVCDWIEKLSGRIDILHLKDMKTVFEDGFISAKPMICEIGNGNLNWRKILEIAQKTGVKEYIVEQDNNFNSDCFSSLKQSADYLNKII